MQKGHMIVLIQSKQVGGAKESFFQRFFSLCCRVLNILDFFCKASTSCLPVSNAASAN
jgi:hypothetical protein